MRLPFFLVFVGLVMSQAGFGSIISQRLATDTEPIETITGIPTAGDIDKAYHRIHGRNAVVEFECGNTQAGDSVQVYKLNVTGDIHEMTVICPKPVFVYKNTRVGFVFPEVKLWATELGYFENFREQTETPQAYSFNPDDNSHITGFGSVMSSIGSGIGQGLKMMLGGLFGGGGGDLSGVLGALKNTMASVQNYVTTNTKTLRSINKWQGTVAQEFATKQAQIDELNESRLAQLKALGNLSLGLSNTNKAVRMLKERTLGQFKLQDEKLVSVVDLISELATEVNAVTSSLWDKMKELSDALSSGLESLRDTSQAAFNRLLDTDRRLARGLRDAINMLLDMRYEKQLRRDLSTLFQDMKRSMADNTPPFVPFTGYPGENSLTSSEMTRDKKYSFVDKLQILWTEPKLCVNPINPVETVSCLKAHQDEISLYCSNKFVLEQTRQEYGWIDIIDTFGTQNCTPGVADFEDVNQCRCWIEYNKVQTCETDVAGWPAMPISPTMTPSTHCHVQGIQNVITADVSEPRVITDVGEWNTFIGDYCSTSNRSNATNITISSFTDPIYWNLEHRPSLCGTAFEDVTGDAEVDTDPTMLYTIYSHWENMFRNMWSNRIRQYEVDVYGTLAFGAKVEIEEVPILSTESKRNVRRLARLKALGVRQDNMVPLQSLEFNDIQTQLIVTIPTKDVLSKAVDPILDVKFQHLAPRNHLRVGSEECSAFPCPNPNHPTQRYTYDPPPQLLLATYNPQQQQGNPTYVMSNGAFDPDVDGPFTFLHWLNKTDASMFDPLHASGSIHPYYRRIDPTTRRCDSNETTPGGSQCTILDFFFWDTGINCPDPNTMCLSPREWRMRGTIVVPWGTIIEDRLEACPETLVQQAGVGGVNVVLTNSKQQRAITVRRELVSSNFLCTSIQEVTIQPGASATELVTAVAGCEDRQVVIKANGTVCTRKNMSFADQTLTLADQNANIVSQTKVDEAANRLSAVGQNMATIIGLYNIGLDPLDYTRQVVGPAIFDDSEMPQVDIKDQLRKALVLITNTTNLLDNNDIDFLLAKSDQNVDAVTAILEAEKIRTGRINNLTIAAAKLANISAEQVANTTQRINQLQAAEDDLKRNIAILNDEIDSYDPVGEFPDFQSTLDCCFSILIFALIAGMIVVGVKAFKGAQAAGAVANSRGYKDTIQLVPPSDIDSME